MPTFHVLSRKSERGSSGRISRLPVNVTCAPPGKIGQCYWYILIMYYSCTPKPPKDSINTEKFCKLLQNTEMEHNTTNNKHFHKIPKLYI